MGLYKAGLGAKGIWWEVDGNKRILMGLLMGPRGIWWEFVGKLMGTKEIWWELDGNCLVTWWEDYEGEKCT